MRRVVRGVAVRAAAPLAVRRDRRRAHDQCREDHLDALRAFSHLLLPGRWRFIRAVRPEKPRKTAFAAVHHESVPPEALRQFSRPLHDGAELRFSRQREIFRAEAHTNAEFSASVVVLLRNSNIMFVDMEKSSAVRWRPGGYSEEYEHDRRVFSRFVPSVGFDISPDRTLLREEFATGGQLARASSDTVLRCLDVLLPSLVGLARGDKSSGPQTAGEWFASGLQEGGFARDVERSARAIAWLGDAPMIPQHNDLHLENVVLSRHQPLCIDFDGIGLRPAWQAALMLCFDAIRRHPEITPHVESRLLRFFAATNRIETPKDWKRLSAVAWEACRGR